jgi:hypothetical protein
MDEKLLQYIWKHKLFATNDLKTVSGDALFIKNFGNVNSDSGPDYVDVQIKMNNALWAGCVELHLKSSDWEKHNHQKDNAYSNVILHAVYEHDKDIFTSNGSSLPTLELKPLINPQLIDTYKNYMSSLQDIVCQNQFGEIDSFRLFSWLDRLLIERLEERKKQIEQLLEETINHKEEAFYLYLANSFGFKTNALPFFLLAKSLPLKYLAKQKDSLLQIEAMLFGQADLLPTKYTDEYSESLKNEYHFLQKKFSLEKMCKASMWKFAKIYPSGFPTIRIAQFAALVHKSSALLSKVLAAENVNELTKLFTVKASDYWNEHYQFGKPTSNIIDKTLGKSAVNSLLINTVLPFIYAYSQWNNDAELQNKVIEFYESLPFENNKITRKFVALRPDLSNALHSQSLTQLYNNYCTSKQCLHCGIGLYLVK